MNIAEILKDCPKGTKLYSPVFGDVYFENIDLAEELYIIWTKNKDGDYGSFTEEGKYRDYADAECLLFPSKDNHDWSTFKAPKQEHEFKPFEKVLVRDREESEWEAKFFSHLDKNTPKHQFCCIDFRWKYCIPYEGNEHLLGTTNNPE